MDEANIHWTTLLLLKIGKRFKIDARYFAKNSAFVFLSQVIAFLKGLITGYLVSRLFPAEMYGEYQFVLTIVGTVSVFAISGLPSAISRAVAREREQAPVIFTLRLYTAFCLLGSLALVGTIPFLGHWHQEKLWPLFMIAAIQFVPTYVSITFFGGIVTGLGDFKQSFTASLAISSLIATSVLLMLLTKPSPLLLLALTGTIPALVYLLHLRKMLRKFHASERGWSILRYGLQITLADIPVTISQYLDNLLISSFFGLHELAIFSIATLIPEQVKIFARDWLPIPFSKQAAGDDTRSRRMHLTVMVGYMTLVLACGISVYILLAPWIIPLLFPRYETATVVPLTRMSALILITVPATLFPQHLEARGMVKDVLYAQWLAAGIFMVALLLFVPHYGPMGALVSRGLFRITYVSYAAIVLWLRPTDAKRKTSEPLRE